MGTDDDGFEDATAEWVDEKPMRSPAESASDVAVDVGHEDGTGAESDHLPARAPTRTSVPLDHAIVKALADGAGPGAVIEQAANAIRVLCPDRGVAVRYRLEDGASSVQAAGIGAHLVMITGDPDSPFWDRARTEEQPNYQITFHAHPEDIEPTSVWCVPVMTGPVAGDVTLVSVGSGESDPPEEDVRTGLEHIARLVAVSLDRKRLVERLDNARDRPDGPSPTVSRGIAPTRGDADEAADTVVLYVRLSEITDMDHIHGHSAAEELTVEVGRRLSATVRPGDTIARLSSTDFALRCYRVTAIQAESIVARVLNDLWCPVVTRWEETRLRPRIGLVRSGEPRPLSALLKDAEAAMRKADSVGRDWLWDGDEVERKPAELGAGPAANGFGAGPQESGPGTDQSEPGRRADSESGSPE